MNKSFDISKFNGKTIKLVNNNSINYIEFLFTDGSSIAIETEYVSSNLYSICTTEITFDERKESGTKCRECNNISLEKKPDYWLCGQCILNGASCHKSRKPGGD